jgi:hypothetical protein
MSTIRTDPDGRRFIDGGFIGSPQSPQAQAERLAKREAECARELWARRRRQLARERAEEARFGVASERSRDAARDPGAILRGRMVAKESFEFLDAYGTLHRVLKGLTFCTKASSAYAHRPSAFSPA